MKPNLLQRIQEQVFLLEDLLGLQSLDKTLDDIEIQRIKSTIDLLKEIENLFN